MSLSRNSKILAHKRYTYWNFNGDGRFDKERVKKKDKRTRNRYRRTIEKRWVRKEVLNKG